MTDKMMDAIDLVAVQCATLDGVVFEELADSGDGGFNKAQYRREAARKIAAFTISNQGGVVVTDEMVNVVAMELCSNGPLRITLAQLKHIEGAVRAALEAALTEAPPAPSAAEPYAYAVWSDSRDEWFLKFPGEVDNRLSTIALYITPPDTTRILDELYEYARSQYECTAPGTPGSGPELFRLAFQDMMRHIDCLRENPTTDRGTP